MSLCYVEYGTINQVNTLRVRQNGPHFADNILKCIFLNENVWILIKISSKFAPKGLINNMPAIGSDNDLAPKRRQAIIWTDDGLFIDITPPWGVKKS